MNTRAVPDAPHPRALRSHGGWLVRRISVRRVRVTSELGYVDVALGRGTTVDDATDYAAAEVAAGRAAWTPIRRPSGPSAGIPHAERQAAGGVRVDVYLDEAEARCLAALVERAGTKRDAVAQAIVDAYEALT